MLVLIAGITGLVGQGLAKQFLHSGHQVRGLARNPSKLPESLHSQLESFVITENYFNVTSLDKAVRGVDAVICTYFPAPHLILSAQLLLLRAAERAGVRIFHAASWNLPWYRNQLGDHEQYDAYLMFRAQARLTSTLKPIFGFTGSIVEYIFSFPAHGSPWDRRTMEMRYFGDGGKEFPYTVLGDLAAYTVAAVTAADAEAGGFYHVESFKCSVLELAETYEQVSGKTLKRNKVGEDGDVAVLLDQTRAAVPATQFEQYVGLAYLKYMLDGTYDYEAVDSERWRHVRQTGLREWFELHPEI